MDSLELALDTRAPGIWLWSDRDVLQAVTKWASGTIHTEQAQQLRIHHPAAVSALPQRAGSRHTIICGAHLPVHTGGVSPGDCHYLLMVMRHSWTIQHLHHSPCFRTLKVVISGAWGPWQIFHEMASNTMHFFSAGSFVFCFTACKTECTNHLTKELHLKEAVTVNKRAEKRCQLVFCPQRTGLGLYSCPPYGLMCGPGWATYMSYASLHL